MPHIGASTEESEENCAVMAANQLMDYLENGHITNSVNYPAVHMGVCRDAGAVSVDAVVTHALCRGEDLALLHAGGIFHRDCAEPPTLDDGAQRADVQLQTVDFQYPSVKG